MMYTTDFIGIEIIIALKGMCGRVHVANMYKTQGEKNVTQTAITVQRDHCSTPPRSIVDVMADVAADLILS